MKKTTIMMHLYIGNRHTKLPEREYLSKMDRDIPAMIAVVFFCM